MTYLQNITKKGLVRDQPSLSKEKPTGIRGFHILSTIFSLAGWDT
jgi:hypothetical protein